MRNTTTMSFFSGVEYWLVYNPNIFNFSWNPPHTPPLSSPLFLSLSISSYLFLTFLLSRLSLPPFPPQILKPLTALHNLTLFLLSLTMSLGITFSILSINNLRLSICFPLQTPPTGPLFFWAYIFYLSKFLEFLDTLFILLSQSTKRRLSFLHVYHHSTVPLMSYLWLHSSQSLFPIALLTNSSVHVIMYAYYFLTGIGIRPPWKRAVTDCQILQFVFSFAVSGLMLYYHFAGSGCSGMGAWCFNAVFNASLLALFLDFHLKSYANVKNKNKNKRHDKDS